MKPKTVTIKFIPSVYNQNDEIFVLVPPCLYTEAIQRKVAMEVASLVRDGKKAKKKAKR